MKSTIRKILLEYTETDSAKDNWIFGLPLTAMCKNKTLDCLLNVKENRWLSSNF